MKARQAKVFSLNVEKVDRRIASKSDRPDFLSYIIKGKDGVTMPLPELYANSTLLVLAGSESTASGLAGITFQLLKHPEALKKAIEEIHRSFKSESDIVPENVKNLPYIAAVVSEGLRMYPPFPEGLPRLTPRQGATICGQYVPGGVSKVSDSPFASANLPSRPMSNSAPTQHIATATTLETQISSPHSAG